MSTKEVEIVYGGTARDKIIAGERNLCVSIFGGEGSDYLEGGNSADVISGDVGNDSLWGEGGDDWLSGGVGNDTYYGGEGNDFLEVSAGENEVYGGAGTDTVSHQSSGLGVVVDLSAGTSASQTTYSDTENIIGSNHSDALYGTSSANIMAGGFGHDEVRGYDGSDEIFGDAGQDSLFGGQGGDILEGGLGHDNLYGGSGSDELFGGQGNDYMRDDSGADLFDGGGGVDSVSFFGHSTGMQLNLQTGANSGGDTFVSIENVYGSDQAGDRIVGSISANHIDRNGGDDTLNGNNGANVVVGVDGDDINSGGLDGFIDARVATNAFTTQSGWDAQEDERKLADVAGKDVNGDGRADNRSASTIVVPTKPKDYLFHGPKKNQT